MQTSKSSILALLLLLLLILLLPNIHHVAANSDPNCWEDTGIISSFAGSGGVTGDTDGNSAATSLFGDVRGLAWDPARHHLYISDIGGSVFKIKRWVESSNTISAVAGTGSWGGNTGAVGTSVNIRPYRLLYTDSPGDGYVWYGTNLISKIQRMSVAPGGTFPIEDVAGDGSLSTSITFCSSNSVGTSAVFYIPGTLRHRVTDNLIYVVVPQCYGIYTLGLSSPFPMNQITGDHTQLTNQDGIGAAGQSYYPTAHSFTADETAIYFTQIHGWRKLVIATLSMTTLSPNSAGDTNGLAMSSSLFNYPDALCRIRDELYIFSDPVKNIWRGWDAERGTVVNIVGVSGSSSLAFGKGAAARLAVPNSCAEIPFTNTMFAADQTQRVVYRFAMDQSVCFTPSESMSATETFSETIAPVSMTNQPGGAGGVSPTTLPSATGVQTQTVSAVKESVSLALSPAGSPPQDSSSSNAAASTPVPVTSTSTTTTAAATGSISSGSGATATNPSTPQVESSSSSAGQVADGGDVLGGGARGALSSNISSRDDLSPSSIFGFSPNSPCPDWILMLWILFIPLLFIYIAYAFWRAASFRRKSDSSSGGSSLNRGGPLKEDESCRKPPTSQEDVQEQLVKSQWMEPPIWRSLLLQHLWFGAILPCHDQCAPVHLIVLFNHVATLLWMSGAITAISATSATLSISLMEQAGFAFLAAGLAQLLRYPVTNNFFYHRYEELPSADNCCERDDVDQQILENTTPSSSSRNNPYNTSTNTAITPRNLANKRSERNLCVNNNSLVALNQVELQAGDSTIQDDDEETTKSQQQEDDVVVDKTAATFVSTQHSQSFVVTRKNTTTLEKATNQFDEADDIQIESAEGTMDSKKNGGGGGNTADEKAATFGAHAGSGGATSAELDETLSLDAENDNKLEESLSLSDEGPQTEKAAISNHSNSNNTINNDNDKTTTINESSTTTIPQAGGTLHRCRIEAKEEEAPAAIEIEDDVVHSGISPGSWIGTGANGIRARGDQLRFLAAKKRPGGFIRFVATPSRNKGHLVSAINLVVATILCLVIGVKLRPTTSSTHPKICEDYTMSIFPATLLVDLFVIQPIVCLIVALYRWMIAEPGDEEDHRADVEHLLHPRDCVLLFGR